MELHFLGGDLGAALVLWRLFKRLPVPKTLAWILTLVVAFYAWLCFYETRTGVLLEKLATISLPWNYTLANLREAVHALDPTRGFVLLCLLGLCAVTLGLEYLSLRLRGEAYYFLRKPVVLVVLVILTVWLAPSEKNDFIYFAF